MKKLLVVGAGFLQSFVIRYAKKLGYYTYAVDANPNAEGFADADEFCVINIVDQEACLSYAREKQIDGVLTAATDYGVLTSAYIAQEMGLPGLNYEVAKLIKNKYQVRKRLFDAHVDDTEQAYEVCGDTDLHTLCAKVVFPVMVKPCDGSGSRGASRVDNTEAFEKACLSAMSVSITHRAVVESFIQGREYGAESLVVNGEVHVLSIMRKWMTEPPYYAELGHAIPTDLPAKIEERAKECVAKAISALGINFGSVNMDMLITEEGTIHIIDVGARMGGNMIGPCIIPYGTGIDYMAAMIRNAVGDAVEIRAKEHHAVATRILAFRSGVVKKIPNIDTVEELFNVHVYHHMHLGDAVNEYHTNLDGCGYIVAVADDVETAGTNAEKAKNFIEECTL